MTFPQQKWQAVAIPLERSRNKTAPSRQTSRAITIIRPLPAVSGSAVKANKAISHLPAKMSAVLPPLTRYRLLIIKL